MPGVARHRPAGRDSFSPRHQRSTRSGGWAGVAHALPPSLRGAALLPAAALAVHQLRYELAYGSHADAVLSAQGHAYLFSMTPWIVLVATLALGVSLGGLARRWASGSAGGAPVSAARVWTRTWLACALTLLAVYSGQELLEGFFATGHPGGFAGVFGDGGWWAVPVALGVGAVLALALRGGAAVVAALRGGVARRIAPPRINALALAQLPAAPALVAPAPLASAAAGRAPPGAFAFSKHA